MNKQEKKLFKFANELITIFTDYIIILDSYFDVSENKENNQFLYEEYKELGKKLRELEEGYK